MANSSFNLTRYVDASRHIARMLALRYVFIKSLRWSK